MVTGVGFEKYPGLLGACYNQLCQHRPKLEIILNVRETPAMHREKGLDCYLENGRYEGDTIMGSRCQETTLDDQMQQVTGRHHELGSDP